jgi:hypothetical protein
VRYFRVAVPAALAACSISAQALEVQAIDARVTGHRYHVQFEGVINAPVERVARVLTDFTAYASLDPRIRESRVIGRSDTGQTLLRTRIRACAGLFCRTVLRTETVTLEAGRLVAEVVPPTSDIRQGITRTQWRGEADRTRIWYQADFEPGFWVPDIIARHYAVNSLRDSVVQLFENVEESAGER